VNPPALTLRHATGTCPVYIGPGILTELPAVLDALLPGRRAVVISDAQVAAAVPAPLDAPLLTFTAGEASKTRDTWARLTDDLLALGVGRDGALVALGGGVTGDLAGFVAATYLRGIPLCRCRRRCSPCSCVDRRQDRRGRSAGKNLVGAHQPAAVVIDPRTFAPPRAKYCAGLAGAVTCRHRHGHPPTGGPVGRCWRGTAVVDSSAEHRDQGGNRGGG
jgi:3-dehydroquinate synthase